MILLIHFHYNFLQHFRKYAQISDHNFGVWISPINHLYFATDHFWLIAPIFVHYILFDPEDDLLKSNGYQAILSLGAKFSGIQQAVYEYFQFL